MTDGGDISEAFDDDDLKRSIESGKDGPWNDEQARFVDPTLLELEKKLSTPERRSYHHRRLDELKVTVDNGGQRPKRSPAAKPARRRPAPDSDAATDGPAHARRAPWLPPDDDTPLPAPGTQKSKAAAETPAELPDPWQDARALDGERRVVPARLELTPAQLQPTRRRPPNEWSGYAPSLFAAVLVAGAVTAAHGAMTDWHADLPLRGAVAALTIGVLWRRLQSTSLRAMAIAAIGQLLCFATTPRASGNAEMLALLVGFGIAALGGLFVGVQRDEFQSRRG